MTIKTTKKAERKTPSSRKIDGTAQYERFREFARETETDQTEEAFERAARKIIPSRRKT